ncbi:MAG: ADP-ribosylglycohydrolase family protein [Oscillospiraceae bacterium]|nr:ADP-ribosylglycohydrolase family protein [Oscillospiraceae bacterium]
MLGAAIGDIAGSIYEHNGIKRKPETLFTPDCRFTDDTAMTAAVTQGLLEAQDELGENWLARPETESVLTHRIQENLQRLGRAYPYAGYGGSFRRWLRAEHPQPYHSWGNGSAMRASCCGWAARTAEEARLLGRCSAIVTHDHPEGIKGAQVVAECILLLRQGASRQDIRACAERYYDMNFTLEEIRPGYRFFVSCQESVPQAIMAFLESDSFEDAVLLAISLGGDADTQAAIAGSLAEAFYGIAPDIRQQALGYLPEPLKAPLLAAEARYGTKVRYTP